MLMVQWGTQGEAEMSSEKHRRNLLRYAIDGLMVVAFFVTLPIGGIQGADVSPADKEAYFHAVADAQNATQHKVRRNLLAIVPGRDKVNDEKLSGNRIRWEGVPGQSRILVVTFVTMDDFHKYYEDNLKDGLSSFPLHKSLWVTVVPEMRNFFIDKSNETFPPNNTRITKLLGLNPAIDYAVLIELWVDPNNLFRPSADPEITDHEAELPAKDSNGFWIFPADRNPFLQFNKNGFADRQGLKPVPFKKWYGDRVESGYKLDDPDPSKWGYPWTRLGYTYDWGNPKNHAGLSEFVIRIDPEQNGGEVTVTLKRAIQCKSPEACGDKWDQYFRSAPESRSADEGEGMFPMDPYSNN
jgi:hypothetical protein